MKSLKIAIIGSRGIPNCYGGFEQLAQYLSAGMVQSGFDVTVYNSHKHPYQEKEWNGVTIVHCIDPEHRWGTAGQFIYDLNCIRHAKKDKFDVILFLGYTSSSIWGRFFPENAVIISNMDGLEWKRSKYPGPVRRFLKYAEKLAVQYSDFLLADSPVIQDYLKNKYNAPSRFIPYGAELADILKEDLLANYNLVAKNYFMLMARMEPENNIEMILEGFHQSRTGKKFIVIGNTNNSFGRLMSTKYNGDKRIIFAGAIYENTATHSIRSFCSFYFHGHSVGGTNPSLLEAMADGALIAAHDNEFNRAVLAKDAYYFSSAHDVKQLIEEDQLDEDNQRMTRNNLAKISSQYNWPAVIKQYEEFITDCYNQAKR